MIQEKFIQMNAIEGTSNNQMDVIVSVWECFFFQCLNVWITQNFQEGLTNYVASEFCSILDKLDF